MGTIAHRTGNSVGMHQVIVYYCGVPPVQRACVQRACSTVTDFFAALWQTGARALRSDKLYTKRSQTAPEHQPSITMYARKCFARLNPPPPLFEQRPSCCACVFTGFLWGKRSRKAINQSAIMKG